MELSNRTADEICKQYYDEGMMKRESWINIRGAQISYDTVTLVTQTSMDRFARLVKIAELWEGEFIWKFALEDSTSFSANDIMVANKNMHVCSTNLLC